MAGYFLYSILQAPFEQFASSPTNDQIQSFLRVLADEYERLDGEDMDEEDEGHLWVDEEEAERVVRKRLKKTNWYARLSEEAAEIFSFAISGFVQQSKEFAFRVEADPIYWDVIDLCSSNAAEQGDEVAAELLMKFGARPYRFELDSSNEESLEEWMPYHAMHFQEDILKMLQAVRLAEAAIEESDEPDVAIHYDVLLQMLEKLSGEPRILLVETDT